METSIENLKHSDVPFLKTITAKAQTVVYGNTMIYTGNVLTFDVVSFHQDANSSTVKVIRRDTGRKCFVQKFGDMPARLK